MRNPENPCNYQYEGCLETDECTWENNYSGSMFVCCKNCYEKRQKKEDEINRKYMDIKPFTGQNEYGEYYDEESY